MIFFLLQNRVDFQDEQLNRIDRDLMQAKKVLLDISEPRRLCLQELGLRRLFVKWVKDALEGACRHYRLCFHSQVIFVFQELSSRKFVNMFFVGICST